MVGKEKNKSKRIRYKAFVRTQKLWKTEALLKTVWRMLEACWRTEEYYHFLPNNPFPTTKDLIVHVPVRLKLCRFGRTSLSFCISATTKSDQRLPKWVINNRQHFFSMYVSKPAFFKIYRPIDTAHPISLRSCTDWNRSGADTTFSWLWTVQEWRLWAHHVKTLLYM